MYHWVLPRNSIEFGEAHLSVFGGKGLQPLRIDPFPWDFEIRPRSVAEAIRFALNHGWSPDAPGPALYLSFRDGAYIVLPIGVRFLYELQSGTQTPSQEER